MPKHELCRLKFYSSPGQKIKAFSFLFLLTLNHDLHQVTSEAIKENKISCCALQIRFFFFKCWLHAYAFTFCVLSVRSISWTSDWSASGSMASRYTMASWEILKKNTGGSFWRSVMVTINWWWLAPCCPPASKWQCQKKARRMSFCF